MQALDDGPPECDILDRASTIALPNDDAARTMLATDHWGEVVMAEITRRGVLKGAAAAGAAIAGVWVKPAVKGPWTAKALAVSPWSQPILPFSGPLPPPLPPSSTPKVDAQAICGEPVDGLGRTDIIVRVAGTTEPLDVYVEPDDVLLGTIQPGGVLRISAIVTFLKTGTAFNGGFILTSSRGANTIRLIRQSDGAIIVEQLFDFRICPT
jgi:hypothetical protein